MTNDEIERKIKINDANWCQEYRGSKCHVIFDKDHYFIALCSERFTYYRKPMKAPMMIVHNEDNLCKRCVSRVLKGDNADSR